jgi:hypothetical protein
LKALDNLRAVFSTGKWVFLSHMGINKRKIWNCGAIEAGLEGFVSSPKHGPEQSDDFFIC